MNTRVMNWSHAAAVCGLSVSMCAWAGPPESLDRVPADAAVTVVIPNVQGFVNDMKAFASAVVPQEQQLQMNMGLAMVQTFLDMPGMDAAGSAAAVMYVEEQGGPDQPPLVVLLPVSDFGQLREGVGATGAGPVFEANMGGGAFYMKDVGGGFVAVGPMAELVQEFSGQAGQVNGHMQRIGRTGEQVIDGNDLTVIANLEVLSPHIRAGAEQMKAQMGMMMAMAGPEAAQAQAGMEMMAGIMDALAEDGQAGLMGLQMSPAGLSVDSGVQFKADSGSANLFAEAGSTAGLLGHLPQSPFMFAYALDAGNPGVSKVFETLTALGEAAGGGQPAGMNYAEMMKDASGVAGVMGTVPLMGAGFLSNVVTITKTENASAVVGTMKRALTDLNGQSAQGIKYMTTFEPAATTIAGVEVARYSMNVAPDGTGGAQFGPMETVMPMLFGPQGGPNGFIAAVDGTVVQTLSQNTPLMEKAIEAARSGNGLGKAQTVQTVAGRLPENRVFEFYMSIDQLMNTVGPMAAAFGAMPGFEEVPALPPVGVGTAIGGGGMLSRLHVPNEVLAWGVAFGQKMQQDQFGGEDGFDPDF